MKHISVLLLLLLVVAVCSTPCAAQKPAQDVKPTVVDEHTNLDNYIQVLRSNLATRKVEIVNEAMDPSDAEAAVFWPVYRNYETDLRKLSDRKIALLKDYAANWDKLSPAKARDLADQVFTFEQDKIALQRKYFREFEKVMPANRVARFFQIDRRLDLLLNLRLAAETPLTE